MDALGATHKCPEETKLSFQVRSSGLGFWVWVWEFVLWFSRALEFS